MRPGQAAHFIGDYRKTAPLFTGTGGFDRGIQGQQIGLIGNALDDLDNAEDCLGLLVQRADDVSRLLRRTGNASHVTDHLVDHPTAVLGQGFCLVGHVQCARRHVG